MIPPLARAIELVNGSPYGERLEAQGTQFRLLAESDVVEYWREAYRDLDRLRRLYGELAPGFRSPLPEFQAWLEAEREEILRGLWSTAVGKAGMLADAHREEEAKRLLLQMEEAYPLEPRTALDLADLYWRLADPEGTARVLAAVRERVEDRARPRLQLNLGAALVRAGRVEEGRRLLEELVAGTYDERYWALLHLGQLEVLSGEPGIAEARAREVREMAEQAGEYELLLLALLLEGEALLRQGRAREAATGPLPAALGLQELAGRPFSSVSLALLAEAQGLWGKGRARAVELAEKAYRRAAIERDPHAISRALFAWAVAARDPEKLQAARHQARLAGHEPWRLFLEGYVLPQ